MALNEPAEEYFHVEELLEMSLLQSFALVLLR